MKSIKYIIMCILVGVTCILAGCSFRSSLIGVWRLESGTFSCGYNTFDHCAIEFNENGEYVIYTGDYYCFVSSRGAYSDSGKQVELIADDYLQLKYNYMRNGNDISIVSSAGTARFKMVDMDKKPKPFDEKMAVEQVYDQGYDVLEKEIRYDDTICEVHMTISTTYNYLDQEIERRDEYEYSPIAESWFLSNSKDVGVTEKWKILGWWKGDTNKFGDELLYISSIGDGEITISYNYPGYWSYDRCSYTGTLPLGETLLQGYTCFSIPSDVGTVWTTIIIHRDRGLYSAVEIYDYLE